MGNVIDLFAGAGGLSLGAVRAGFHLKAAVELDRHALQTHSRNFPGSKHLALDIAKLRGGDLLNLAGLDAGELSGLIGGPPCQGFSSIGNRNVEDERNDLFSHFFRIVAETQPAFFVAENVPGILSSRYDDVRAKALANVPEKYVVLPPIHVQANLYGAPTTRKRIFFIGFDPKKLLTPLLPANFAPPPNVEPATVARTLLGLPERIDGRWQSEELAWRVAESCAGQFLAHRIRGFIPPGVGDPVSLRRFHEEGEVSGCFGTKHSDALKKRYGALGYGKTDPGTKSRRLDPDGFCPTLRAGTGSDKGSFQAVRPIHFSRPRVITPREAARLQGFPDWFVFHSTKWHSFRQIGNSVSPIVAEHILSPIFENLAI